MTNNILSEISYFYEFRADFVYLNKDKEIDQINSNREFKNINPIIGREEALKFYQNYIYGLLKSINMPYPDDNQAKENLFRYFNEVSDKKIKIEGQPISINNPFICTIGVFFHQAIFIEAKVKTFQGHWGIFQEFEKFKKDIEGTRMKSNLFTQLYYKVRLVKVLRTNKKQLHDGVKFPKCSSKYLRKIGTNEVVKRAVDQLEPYCMKAFFISLVPDDSSNLEMFYQNELKEYKPKGFQDWDISCWGFLTWADVEEFCYEFKLLKTIENFKFNIGQIYTNNQVNN